MIRERKMEKLLEILAKDPEASRLLFVVFKWRTNRDRKQGRVLCVSDAVDDFLDYLKEKHGIEYEVYT